MRMTELIEQKKAGAALTEAEIRWMIRAYTDGEIPDYQMSAMAMAICWRGMDDGETAVLTDAMMHSGDTVDLSSLGALTVDKHSTGGVGDKTTLIVAPTVAALGAKVAKMSGRGLGHTGGTVDKLESIPGYRTQLPRETFLRIVREIGVAVIGQSGNLCPADKKLYALRDVTGTVDSLPLIASSVMSKKLAAGAQSIVLDVKVGSGAFMTNEDDGRALAEKMVEIGRRSGRNIAAVLTDMDVPLGRAVGNALEVQEAVRLLQGHGDDDLKTVCVTLSAVLLSLCHGWTQEEAIQRTQEAMENGQAFETMCRWISAQGGDINVLHDPTLLPHAAVTQPVLSPGDGWIAHMDTRRIGEAAVLLGAGRSKKDDVIDPGAGLILERKTGERVSAGQPLAVLHTDRPEMLTAAAEEVLAAVTLGDTQPAPRNLILDVVGM